MVNGNEEFSGYYVYIDATHGKTSVRSQLRSPYETFDDVTCLTFYAHMFGNDIGALYVYAEDIYGNTNRYIKQKV